MRGSCSAGGGGGERVLWVGVKALLDSVPSGLLHILIYARHSDTDKDKLFAHVKVWPIVNVECFILT